MDGLKYSTGEGWVKVSKGALIVMKTKLQHGIYFLEGCTIRGMMTVSQSLDQFNYKIDLRHHRLGYISKKGMAILSK